MCLIFVLEFWIRHSDSLGNFRRKWKCNENGVKRIKSKSLTIKKTKPKTLQIPNKITPIHNAIQPQKIANTSVVRIPQNNNSKPNITVIHGYKQTKLTTNLQLTDGKSLDCHKTANSSSGLTITAVKGTVNTKTYDITKLSKTSLIPAASKPNNSVTIVPKPNVVSISPSNKVAATFNKVAASPVNVAGASRPAKRINPMKISDTVTNRASSIEKSSDSDMMSRDSTAANEDMIPQKPVNGTNQPNESSPPAPKRPRIDTNQKPQIRDNFKALMAACKSAESSDEMKKVIDKLEKNYHRAHPEYISSKCFRKLVKTVTDDIKKHPTLVYIKIANFLEELKTRRTMEGATPTVEDPELAKVNKKKTKRIQQLSDALHDLQKKIRACEEAEVDWDDEFNSNYLLTERYKKRAFDIYEKLCDLMGESRNAERIIKKPIKFKGTRYEEFNRKLEKFVNDKNAFPDLFDVLRIMDYCNTEYNYRMNAGMRKDIAQDAFAKIGNLLQERRKRDLYEMVQYYTSNNNDPAREDPTLKSKLDDSHRHYGNRMDEVIDKFTRQQHRDSSDDDGLSARNNENIASSSKNSNVPTTSAQTSTKSVRRPKTPTSTPTPQPQPQTIKMDIGLDIDDDNDLIIPEVMQLIDDEAMEEIEKEMEPTGLFPTITSVTSLHPSNDRFAELLDASTLEPSNIL